MNNKINQKVHEVESSCIAAIITCDDKSTMDIKFNSGKTYRYFYVYPNTIDRFLSAESHGKFFHENIKGQYIYAILGDDGYIDTYGKDLILDKIGDVLEELVNSSENYQEIIESGESTEINGFDFLAMAKDEIESSSNTLYELLSQLEVALEYEGIPDMYSYIRQRKNLSTYEMQHLEGVDYA